MLLNMIKRSIIDTVGFVDIVGKLLFRFKKKNNLHLPPCLLRSSSN